ncbi:selenophosphate synthetase [Nonlabens mediterrranea]|uniref:Selenophosphate synthetase n=1 Tax=Nonlabens mediterrranea TaxID=1419947 RepID=A0ABS0A133_9FLAO|nr:selenophosphate synthetase [Nonlabens mediterrranea]
MKMMKKTIAFILLTIAIYSCKNTEKKEEKKALTNTEQVAQAAGFENWDAIKEVKFTFSVGKMGRNLYNRNWTWNRQTGDVTLIAAPDTVYYNRRQPMDSIQTSADRAFVNDIYWLLPEFKFITDSGTKIIEKSNAVAPISKDTLDMFTIVYSNDGGYTPGDAYDVYYDKKHNLREWVYRQQNDTTIGMMTTFEKFDIINGIKVATDHRTPDRMTRIHLTNIEFNK